MGTLTRIPPYDGTLRLYVDGTLGNDNASGQGGWANAWKTAEKLNQAAAAILFIEPTGLEIRAYVRGAFSTEDISIGATETGSSRFRLCHAIADQTLSAAGTLTAVTAATERHGLTRLTLGGGIVLSAAHLGATLLLTDGVNIGTCTIAHVDAANNYAWCSKVTYPGWVVGGGGITAMIYTPSVSGIREVEFCVSHSGLRSANLSGRNIVLGVSCDRITFDGGQWFCGVKTVGVVAFSMILTGSAYILGTAVSSSMDAVDVAAVTEAGFMAGAAGFCDVGNNLTGATSNSCYALCGSTMYALSGYCPKGIWSDGPAYTHARRGSFGDILWKNTGRGYVENAILRGKVECLESANGYIYGCTWPSTADGGIPAAGIPGGLMRVATGATLQTTLIEGVNTGTGATLYGLNAEREANFHGSLNGIQGKHGMLYCPSGRVRSNDAVSLGSSEGLAPDIYIGGTGSLDIADNLTKSAVNSETAIQSGVDGQITAGTKRFTSATAVFTAAHVGRSVKISVTINAGNVGVHEITAFIDANNVTLNNMAAPVNEGPGLTWGLVGTPRPIFEVARGGRISQADGKTFTVRIPGVEPAPGSGIQEWSKQGYGLANTGFAHIHEGGEAVLGTLALSGVGAAGAGGIAAKIKNASKLLHKGGAVILGTAPLDLGGNAGAIAWPATPSSDAAAAAPQQCIVIPNVP